jgi:hypothetical protein
LFSFVCLLFFEFILCGAFRAGAAQIPLDITPERIPEGLIVNPFGPRYVPARRANVTEFHLAFFADYA